MNLTVFLTNLVEYKYIASVSEFKTGGEVVNGEITKSTIVRSLFWKLLERGGTLGIQLLVMVVLTRILLPEDYGIFAIVIVFISIGSLLVDSGFGEALIQKKRIDDSDISSVFFLNLLVASIIYILLFFIAPYIAVYFEAPQLKNILRTVSLTLFLSSFNSCQYAIVSRKMDFEKVFRSSLVAAVISGIVGLTMAFTNFGIWSLVGQLITQQFLVTTILWFTVKWRPKLQFSLKRASSLFSFGWKLVVSTLIYNLYTSLQNIIIGKVFNSTVLGYYSRGSQLPNILVSNINGSIQSVMFPALASQQDNIYRVKVMVRRVIVTSSFIIFPMLVGLAIIAEPLVKVLFTEKWLPIVPFLQVFCGYYALWAIDATNLHVIKALGRSDIFLKLEILKFFIGIVILIISIPFGVYGIAYGVLINRLISTIIDAIPNKYLIHYGFLEQIKDTLPTCLLTLAMGSTIWNVRVIDFSEIWIILIQICVGITLYIGLAKLFRVECYTFLIFSIKELILRKKGSISWYKLKGKRGGIT